MYVALLFLAFSGSGLATTISRSVRSADQPCTVIFAKPADQCVGKISECWSPGQFDVDCDNGQTVCCFDGCVNVCSGPAKTCRTEYQLKYENATKEMCRPEDQPPNCYTVVTEDCNDKCEDVCTIEPTIVTEDVCETFMEPVCEPVVTETCVPPGEIFFLCWLEFLWFDEARNSLGNSRFMLTRYTRLLC